MPHPRIRHDYVYVSRRLLRDVYDMAGGGRGLSLERVQAKGHVNVLAAGVEGSADFGRPAAAVDNPYSLAEFALRALKDRIDPLAGARRHRYVRAVLPLTWLSLPVLYMPEPVAWMFANFTDDRAGETFVGLCGSVANYRHRVPAEAPAPNAVQWYPSSPEGLRAIVEAMVARREQDALRDLTRAAPAIEDVVAMATRLSWGERPSAHTLGSDTVEVLAQVFVAERGVVSRWTDRRIDTLVLGAPLWVRTAESKPAPIDLGRPDRGRLPVIGRWLHGRPVLTPTPAELPAIEPAPAEPEGAGRDEVEQLARRLRESRGRAPPDARAIAETIGTRAQDPDELALDLRDVDLAAVEWPRQAQLEHVDLTGANLAGSRLVGARLRDAVLRGAVLKDADLTGADLSDADLTGADLRGAVLDGASLAGAIVQGTEIAGASLEGADLAGIRFLGEELPRPGRFLRELLTDDEAGVRFLRREALEWAGIWAARRAAGMPLGPEVVDLVQRRSGELVLRDSLRPDARLEPIYLCVEHGPGLWIEDRLVLEICGVREDRPAPHGLVPLLERVWPVAPDPLAADRFDRALLDFAADTWSEMVERLSAHLDPGLIELSCRVHSAFGYSALAVSSALREFARSHATLTGLWLGLLGSERAVEWAANDDEVARWLDRPLHRIATDVLAEARRQSDDAVEGTPAPQDGGALLAYCRLADRDGGFGGGGRRFWLPGAAARFAADLDFSRVRGGGPLWTLADQCLWDLQWTPSTSESHRALLIAYLRDPENGFLGCALAEREPLPGETDLSQLLEPAQRGFRTLVWHVSAEMAGALVRGEVSLYELGRQQRSRRPS
jgi:hypothetical protein